ncbi:NAD(P)-dependent oxidoreductase [Nocardioides caldifontis]|uniref:NAD(P)-dependent oxidoreductase n=1 Tax=Nocardioides caldifontis TaxID=2588938 RepID=UPI0011DF1219|nr:NAD(P)-dependent oxidoreductase [Nocardioides caldifontis]
MRVLVASPLDPGALDLLGSRHDLRVVPSPGEAEFCASIADRQAVAVRSGVVLNEQVMAAAPDLRIIVRAGSGLDNIDLGHARQRGVRVVRVNGVSSVPVAEMTFALLLALARNVVVADRELRSGHWPKPLLGGPMLRGKTLGVVGAGRIGGLVGEMAHAWGMRVLGCVADPRDEARRALATRGVTLTDLDTVVAEADFLCLHVPLCSSTRYLVDADLLARMKPGSLLVNMARGGVVDEQALARALQERTTVVGAALDVHENEGEGVLSPLAGLDNVVLTPHIGAMALEAQQIIGSRVVDLIDAFEAERLEQEVQDGELVV